MNLRLLAAVLMGCTLLAGGSYAQEADADAKATKKQRYLKTLTSPPDFDDPNYIGTNYVKISKDSLFSFSGGWELPSVMWSIRNETLNQDLEIQRALIAIRDHHPVTSTRAAAAFALTPKSPSEQKGIISSRPNVDKTINRTRNYCTAESLGAKPVETIPEAFIDALTPLYDNGILGQDFNDKKVQGVDIFAKEVSGGWLTGYGKVPSLGLHYVPRDTSLETTFLLGGTVHAIIEKADSDSVLVLSNRGRKFWGEMSSLCPSALVVSEVTETAEGEFEIIPLRSLPARVQKVSQLESGDLFISFGQTCFTRGIESPSTGPRAQDQYFFNPPIGLTATGHIYDVCEMGSSTRRW